MTSAIYEIRNKISGGVYFGRSVDAEDRLRHHKNELLRNVHRNKRLQNSWNKYGKDAFDFKIIWKESPELLCDLEGFILDFLWGDSRLYNHHKKSFGGFEPGNKLGCFKRSTETKEKMSRAFSGRVFSESHRQKIRESKIGVKPSLEARLKMSQKRLGIPRPDVWHQKMAGRFVGEKNPMFGKPSPMRGKKFPVIKCEHCGKEASKGNYIRWHGQNCRNKE